MCGHDYHCLRGCEAGVGTRFRQQPVMFTVAAADDLRRGHQRSRNALASLPCRCHAEPSAAAGCCCSRCCRCCACCRLGQNLGAKRRASLHPFLQGGSHAAAAGCWAVRQLLPCTCCTTAKQRWWHGHRAHALAVSSTEDVCTICKQGFKRVPGSVRVQTRAQHGSVCMLLRSM